MRADTFFTTIFTVNLMIAKMTSAYEKIRVRSTEYRALQRMDLVIEFKDDRGAPPPLNLFELLISGTRKCLAIPEIKPERGFGALMASDMALRVLGRERTYRSQYADSEYGKQATSMTAAMQRIEDAMHELLEASRTPELSGHVSGALQAWLQHPHGGSAPASAPPAPDTATGPRQAAGAGQGTLPVPSSVPVLPPVPPVSVSASSSSEVPIVEVYARRLPAKARQRHVEVPPAAAPVPAPSAQPPPPPASPPERPEPSTPEPSVDTLTRLRDTLTRRDHDVPPEALRQAQPVQDRRKPDGPPPTQPPPGDEPIASTISKMIGSIGEVISPRSARPG